VTTSQCGHLNFALFLALGISTTAAFAGNSATGENSVVSGGVGNSAAGAQSVIGGGLDNNAVRDYSTIGGGDSNVANGRYSTIAGGAFNATDFDNATVGGGTNNYAFGFYSTVPGGRANYAGGSYSFAAGAGAQIRDGDTTNDTFVQGDAGSFVWADAGGLINGGLTPTPFTSSGVNQFLIRANGGFGLNSTPVSPKVAMTIVAPTSNPGYASIFLRQSNSNNGILVTSGDASSGSVPANFANNAAFYVDQFNGASQKRRLSLGGNGDLTVTANAYKPGGGAWAASSDARLKVNVLPLDHALDRLLSLHGVTFEYAHPDAGMHPEGTFTGFIAQDVEPIFPNWIGHDDKGYMTVGPQGFEALTVESLRALDSREQSRNQSEESRFAVLEEHNANLQSQIDVMQQKLDALSNQVSTPQWQNLQR
jgi:hypothetical protein